MTTEQESGRKQVKLAERATAVAFKHEGEADGMIIGPVWFMIDGGAVPVPLMESWQTLRDARAMAEHYGLELEEV